MGTVSRVLLVILRLGELTCGAVVLGILGRFFHLVDDAGLVDPSGRLVYAAVVAALTILAALIFIAPFAYSFWSFPIDFFLFAAWLAAFCVLETLTGTNTCESDWYRSYWGFYWGRWYRDASPGVDVMRTGCAAWRTVLAFSFIAMILYLLSGFLGIYWTFAHGKFKSRSNGFLQSVTSHCGKIEAPDAPDQA
ncbi:hypothetical protein C8A00DRAFT_45146 [Chaetomidium leptoderma]|uniref:MARVEL domain-containing protein n=1 Tax=Chaetomidium leptoderma TaxID=669021 RepID=A0AAN6VHP6_9PEZI|nr:hypothetical protein C8A00DRAFT_45146 [Chaetomidium leptoderma]